VYDPEKNLLDISSPDPDAEVPSWTMERIPVSAVIRIEPTPDRKKTTFIVKVKAEAVH
jgi:hypothetical protein